MKKTKTKAKRGAYAPGAPGPRRGASAKKPQGLGAKVLLIVRPREHAPPWWPPETIGGVGGVGGDCVYRCKCSWVGSDPDRRPAGARRSRRGRLTCPTCWHHNKKRIEVAPKPSWVTVTTNDGWTAGVDRAKRNWVLAIGVSDLQLLWIADYAHPDGKTVRTWEFRTVDAKTAGDNGTLAGVHVCRVCRGKLEP